VGTIFGKARIMTGFDRILVPLDESEFAERALEPALMIAKAAAAEAVLLRVAEPISRTRELLKSPKLYHDFEPAAYREAAGYLKTLRTQLPYEEVSVQTTPP
jgi:nucleotide-binding universal stress UspA family protein